MHEYGKPTMLRLPQETLDAVDDAAVRMKVSKHDAMRQAITVGLEDLKAIDYKVAKAVVTAAKNRRGK